MYLPIDLPTSRMRAQLIITIVHLVSLLTETHLNLHTDIYISI